MPPLGNGGFTAEAEALALRICGCSEASEAGGAAASDAPDPEALSLAYRIADAQIEFMRVWRARQNLIAMRFADPGYRTSEGLTARIAMLSKAGDRLANGEPIPPAMAHAIHHWPQGAAKYADILAELSAELGAMAPDRRNPSAAGGSDFGKTISGDKSHGIKAG